MTNNKIKASTQEHLDVGDISENLVLLKNGSVAMILLTTAVNFDILSEAEQDATIYAYGALLNSLSFPVQILIRSKKADISSYFAHLADALASQPNPDLKAQIKKYMDFIQSTVQQRTVLDKRFYLIISFSTLELGLTALKRPKGTKMQSKAKLIADAKISLMPKRDHLIKQTARLGLVTKQLATKELIELFYDIYNPATSGTQKIIIDEGSYKTPIVEPAVEVPVPSPVPYSTQETPPTTQPDVFPIRSEQVLPTQNQQASNTQAPNQSNVQQPSVTQDTLAALRDATAKANQLLNQQKQTSQINTNIQTENQNGQ